MSPKKFTNPTCMAVFFLTLCHAFISSHSLNISNSSDEKSQFLEIKWRNLEKIAKFLKKLGYREKFWAK